MRFVPLRCAAASLLVALALAGCGAAQGGSEPVAPDTAGAEVAGTATAILNAGVMAEIGEAHSDRVKFLFDPLYDDHFGSLAELPPELVEALVSGAPPYDGVTAVFVSHAHGDHFSARQLARMLAAQPDLVLVAPAQALERLRADGQWEERFAHRVRTISLDNGEAGAAFELAGATIEAFRSPHSGWPERHGNVHNITFRVAVPAGEGQVGRVMHLGDADPASVHFAALRSFLDAKRNGLAMVPYWHYAEPGFDELLDRTFNAQSAVAMHVPVAVPRQLLEGDRPYFSKPGEMVEIPATR